MMTIGVLFAAVLAGGIAAMSGFESAACSRRF
jgi:hypothetical protein